MIVPSPISVPGRCSPPRFPSSALPRVVSVFMPFVFLPWVFSFPDVVLSLSGPRYNWKYYAYLKRKCIKRWRSL